MVHTCNLRRRASIGMTLRMGSSTTRAFGLLLTRQPFSVSQSAPSRYRPDTKQPAGNKTSIRISVHNSSLMTLRTVSVITLSRSVTDFILTAVLGHLCVQCGEIQRPAIFPTRSLDQGSQVGLWDMESREPHNFWLPLIHLV